MNGCALAPAPQRRHSDPAAPTATPVQATPRSLLDAPAFEAAAAAHLALVRLDGRPLSLLSIGLDRAHGDTGAHARFVQTCLVVLRQQDVVGQVESARVLALLPDTPAVGARCAAERLRTAMAALDAPAQPRRRLSVSVGIVTTRTGVTSCAALRSRADAKRDDARARGGNRVEA